MTEKQLERTLQSLLLMATNTRPLLVMMVSALGLAPGYASADLELLAVKQVEAVQSELAQEAPSGCGAAFEVREESEYPGCSQNQANALRARTQETAEIIAGLKLKVLAKETAAESQKVARQWRKAGRILDCAARKIEKGIRFSCVEMKNADGMALPLTRRVWIDPDAIEKGKRHMRALILHEATHLCATNDAAYFDGVSGRKYRPYPQHVRLTSWARIADTYYFWAYYGFCDPEKGCEPKPEAGEPIEL